MLDNYHKTPISSLSLSVYETMLLNVHVKSRYRESLSNFIKIFGMAPNAIFCSKQILDILSNDEDITTEGDNTYYCGYRVVTIHSNNMLWYLFRVEDDLEQIRYLMDDVDSDLLDDISKKVKQDG